MYLHSGLSCLKLSLLIRIAASFDHQDDVSSPVDPRASWQCLAVNWDSKEASYLWEGYPERSRVSSCIEMANDEEGK